jgi:hypothetical protein
VGFAKREDLASERLAKLEACGRWQDQPGIGLVPPVLARLTVLTRTVIAAEAKEPAASAEVAK